MSPKRCDRHVVVFDLSKYRQQLSECQGLMAWLFGRCGKEPGKARSGWESSTPHRAWGPSTQGVTVGVTHGQGFLPHPSKHQVRGERWEMAPFPKGWFGGTDFLAGS